MPSSLLGTEIGGYRIEEKLGEGGMGTVYRALETSLGRQVALKLLNPGLARDPSIVERFRAEARAQANLNHPNITTLYAFAVQDENAMIAMEYIKGETLREIVKRRGPIPADEALVLFRQVLAGVGAAHKVGIIHRDIKPSNLMLNDFGIVKVMDFGIAKVTGNNALTRTGLQLGTLYYMSPEQVKGEPVDVRSDIYSLGITLYQMVTARVPFEGDSEFKIMSDHVNTAPPLPTSLCPSVPEPIERAILKALEKDPTNRFQTVDEFAAALTLESSQRPASAPVTTASLVAAPSIAEKPRSRRKWILAIPAAAVVLIAAGAAAYFWFLPKQQLNLIPPPAPAAQIQPVASPTTAPAAAATPPATVSKPETAAAPVSHVSKLPATKTHSERAAISPPVANGIHPPSSAVTEETEEPASTPSPAASTAPAAAPVPPPVAPPPVITVIVPAGSVMRVHLAKQFDAASIHQGQAFEGVLSAPVNVNGKPAIPAGATVNGQISGIHHEGFLRHSSRLELSLTEVMVKGQSYSLHTPDSELEIRPGTVFGKISSMVSGIGHNIDDQTDNKSGTATAPPADIDLQFRLSQPVIVAVH